MTLSIVTEVDCNNIQLNSERTMKCSRQLLGNGFLNPKND